MNRKKRKKVEAEQREQISGERNRLARLIEETEKRIDALEQTKAEIEQIMADPQTYENKKRVVQLQKDLVDTKRELPLLYTKWEEAEMLLKKLLDSVKTTNK
jgi:hypothetical protein